MIINIIGGLGVMGQIHKDVFEKEGHKVIISGRNSEISIQEASKVSDLTIISVPISATEEVIKKVAPFCKAIMDFTSLKNFPIEAMLKYSDDKCEVAGLHPLYGKVKSIKERTIVYCKTKKSGKMCDEIVECLKKQGAIIKEMDAKEHDKMVSSMNQALRVKIITAFLSTFKEEGFSFKEAYELSPPPGKNIIELASRQLSEENDELYSQIFEKEEFYEEIEKIFIDNFLKVRKNYSEIAKELRGSFEKDLFEMLKNKASIKID